MRQVLTMADGTDEIFNLGQWTGESMADIRAQIVRCWWDDEPTSPEIWDSPDQMLDSFLGVEVSDLPEAEVEEIVRQHNEAHEVVIPESAFRMLSAVLA